jgi:hypothetical protein
MKETGKGIIGFTTTIPVELIFAAGYTPCDLNNVFIADEHVQLGERHIRCCHGKPC